MYFQCYFVCLESRCPAGKTPSDCEPTQETEGDPLANHDQPSSNVDKISPTDANNGETPSIAPKVEGQDNEINSTNQKAAVEGATEEKTVGDSHDAKSDNEGVVGEKSVSTEEGAKDIGVSQEIGAGDGPASTAEGGVAKEGEEGAKNMVPQVKIEFAQERQQETSLSKIFGPPVNSRKSIE